MPRSPKIVIPTAFTATIGLDERLTAAGYEVVEAPPGPRTGWTDERSPRSSPTPT